MISKIIKKIVPKSVKNWIRKSRKKSDFKKFQDQAERLTKADLMEGFRAAGIESGDVLFIHSSLRGLGFIENGPVDIIEAFSGGYRNGRDPGFSDFYYEWQHEGHLE